MECLPNRLRTTGSLLALMGLAPCVFCVSCIKLIRQSDLYAHYLLRNLILCSMCGGASRSFGLQFIFCHVF